MGGRRCWEAWARWLSGGAATVRLLDGSMLSVYFMNDHKEIKSTRGRTCLIFVAMSVLSFWSIFCSTTTSRHGGVPNKAGEAEDALQDSHV
ncbi:hypothetical protein C4D60_Mb03t12220 [Musa balbisiana]|uniref:Uncharacterized protein n=1 Tax=Musa balbisiana TaxID=52838 RepID=A0A4S8J9C1_MUSBA|nr:hypothetical protein C4D60_Mb03t12220 [Musa balbisiana]